MRAARTHAPLAPLAPLPEDDRLLDSIDCARRMGMHPRNWVRYALRWQRLVEAAVVVRVTPGTRGRMKWPRSALVEHIHLDLKVGERVEAAS